MTIVLKDCTTCACPVITCSGLTGDPVEGFFTQAIEVDGCGSIAPGNSVFFLVKPVGTILTNIDIAEEVGLTPICSDTIVDLGGLGFWRSWSVVMPLSSVENCGSSQPIATDSNAIIIASEFPSGGDSDVPCIACTRDCSTAGVQEVFFPTTPAPVEITVTAPAGTSFFYISILNTNGDTEVTAGCFSPTVVSSDILISTSCIYDIVSVTVNTDFGGCSVTDTPTTC